MTSEPRALYELDIHVEFVGPIPERYNRAAPEVTEAHFAAADAVREALEAYGFVVSHTGHGSLRTGTLLPK